jgi:hypothetical protein
LVRRESNSLENGENQMRRPRVLIWLLVLGLVLAVLGSAIWTLAERSRRYRSRADALEKGLFGARTHAKAMRACAEGRLDIANASAADCAHHAERAERFVKEIESLVAAYRRVERYPWLAAPQREPPAY